MAKKIVNDFLEYWIPLFSKDVFYSPTGTPEPEKLVESLSVESMRHKKLSAEHQKALTAFRHLNTKDRLRVALTVLEKLYMAVKKPIKCEVIGCPGIAMEEIQIETKVGNFSPAGMRAVCTGHHQILTGLRPWEGPIAFVVEVLLSGPKR